MKRLRSKTKELQLAEWHRTVILLILLAFAFGFIVWTQNSYESNFTNSF